MATKHSLTLLLPPGTSEDAAREAAVEQMLSQFPDAVVDNKPSVLIGDGSTTVNVMFTSPMFDLVASQMSEVINNEIDSLCDHLRHSPLTQNFAEEYNMVLETLRDRLNYIFATAKE